jgi:hypothetical protein
MRLEVRDPETLTLQIVLDGVTADICKRRLDDVIAYRVRKASATGKGSEMLRTLLSWYYWILDGQEKAIEEGPVSWLPTRRGGG